jgi:GNAT superfamily N-acetyltransferase
LTEHDHVPIECAALIEGVIWGSSGLRYRVLTCDYERLPGGRCFALRDASGRALATVSALSRTWGWFLLLLAVDPAHERQGLGRELLGRVRAILDQRLVVGTVEYDNHRSLSACRAAGLHARGRLETLCFVRVGQLIDPRLRRATPDERREILAELGSAAVPEEALLSECWVWDDGGPKAFVQAVVHRWTITGMGGAGFVVLPALRALRALDLLPIDLANFAFLSLHHRWGAPERFDEFWAALLGEHHVHAAVTFGTPDAPDWRSCKREVHRGLIGVAVGSVSLHIVSTDALPDPFVYSPAMAM